MKSILTKRKVLGMDRIWYFNSVFHSFCCLVVMKIWFYLQYYFILRCFVTMYLGIIQYISVKQCFPCVCMCLCVIGRKIAIYATHAFCNSFVFIFTSVKIIRFKDQSFNSLWTYILDLRVRYVLSCLWSSMKFTKRL